MTRFQISSRRGAASATLMAAFIAAGAQVPSAQAMSIKAVFDSSITKLSNASQIESAFNTVAADYASQFAGPATVYVGVSWGSVGGYALPSNAVGASIDPLYGYFTYAQIKSWLTASSASSPADTALATAVKNLPAAAPSGVTRYVLPSAEAKALGLISPSQTSFDGSIGFAGLTSGFDFNPNDGVTAGTYDFEAVAAHELDEVLGRISGLSSTSPTFRTPFDLFRYSAPGVLNDAYNSSAYFSIDGGKTHLGNFNNSASGGDRADWLTLATSSDIQDAFVSKGQRLNLTAADLTGLDVLGWGGSNLGDTGAGTPTAIAFHLIQDPQGAVPEPSIWALAVAGFALIGARLRRRSPQLSAA